MSSQNVDTQRKKKWNDIQNSHKNRISPAKEIKNRAVKPPKSETIEMQKVTELSLFQVRRRISQ